MNARPITWPTVPKGKDRVRVCLHAGNMKEDVDRLIRGIVAWAEETLSGGLEVKVMETKNRTTDLPLGMVESKL